MRHLQILSCTAAFLAAATTPGLASVSVPIEQTPPAASTATEVKPTKVGIMPHRAIYDMKLSSVKNGSSITGVSGRMLFEWSDVCDGWAVQQHMKLHFNYSEGDESEVSSTEVTWEAKDGKQYNFNVRRVSDGKETERYVGKAIVDGDGGVVTYSVPEGKTMKLPPGTLFPSSHTSVILQKAASGEKLFSRHIFDGSDEDGSNDVSAFINAPIAKWQDAEVNPKLKTNVMMSQSAWPVRLAFFKTNTETGESDYEMNLNLLANGVVRTMQIDYGDFSVTGTLNDIEPLPSPGC
ncbi:MAG: cell envelope integrity EipB family protein [Alphaproteobacteria bacterium]